ncbi:MAG: hypothetical protein AAGJ82_07885 [Bacteroidota bacterium]
MVFGVSQVKGYIWDYLVLYSLAAPNDINKRVEEIQDLIATDKVRDAIKLLLGFVRDFSDEKEDVNEVIVISQKSNRLEKLERRGAISFDDATTERNKLLYQILDFMDSIVDNLAFKLAA